MATAHPDYPMWSALLRWSLKQGDDGSEAPARAKCFPKPMHTDLGPGGADRGARDEETRTRTTNLATYDCDAITFCTKTATSPSWSRGMPLSSQNWIATILGSSPRFQLICKPGRPASSTGKEKS